MSQAKSTDFGRSLLAISAFLIATYAFSTKAAELRTTACREPVCRTVSYAQEQVPVPMPETPGGAVDETVVPAAPVGKGFVQPPCAACGVPDCHFECLMPCNLWVRLENLVWWRKGQDLPALVTTSTDGTAQADAGVLGLDSTTVLYGQDEVGTDARPGGRVTIGAWLDAAGCQSVSGRFYALGQQTTLFTTSSDGSPTLARPFFDDLTSSQASRLLAYPGFSTSGQVSVQTESDVLGGDFLYRWMCTQYGSSRLDLMTGYQFGHIDEQVTISDITEAVNIPLIDPGTTIAITDHFDTSNEFHGGLIGLAWEHQGVCWRLEFLAKVAFGNVRQKVGISGQTTVVTPPPGSTVSVQNQGLLAQGANLGSFTRDKFAVSPELAVTLAYQLNDHFELHAGYSYIYWSSIAQAADQIDPSLVVPASSFAIQDSGYWLHGINVGGQYRF